MPSWSVWQRMEQLTVCYPVTRGDIAGSSLAVDRHLLLNISITWIRWIPR